MISRKKLIEYLEEWHDRLGISPPEVAAKIMIKAFIDKVNAQPAVDVTDINVGSKWIPVTEELPKGRKVLLQTEGKQMVVAFLTEKLEWYVDSGDYYCTDLSAKPIAWKPLPEPYMEEK